MVVIMTMAETCSVRLRTESKSGIAIVDANSSDDRVAGTRRVFEAWILVGAIYFVLCFACTTFFRRLENRWEEGRRGGRHGGRRA